MRILSVTIRGYRGSNSVVEPLFLYFTLPLRAMGHTVDTLDHYRLSAEVGPLRCAERIVQTIKRGNFDLVLYQSGGLREPAAVELFTDLARQRPIVSWNSDDDWQWESSTHRLVKHFTYVITTYPHVYESARSAAPNLILSQWGCLKDFGSFHRAKDLDFAFAGAIYKIRNEGCRYLRGRAGLIAFGQGARLANRGIPYFRGAFRVPLISGPPLDFRGINDVWNRTKVSYTPLGGGPRGEVLSLKSRIFDMGLSGTLMLCEHASSLERYYEPGKECVTFSSLEECAEKALYFASHESERYAIASAYRARTMAEHLWTHRFRALFREIGL